MAWKECIGLLIAVATAGSSSAGKPVTPQPLSDTGDWITPNDYPPDALRQNQTGNVGFRLDVSVTGIVTACTVTLSSGLAELDKTACDLLTARGRFTPGTDRHGKPIAGTYSSSVRWQIPHERLPFQLRGQDELIEFDVAKDGTIENCTDEGAMDPKQTFCDRFDRVAEARDGQAIGEQHVVARTSVVIEQRPAPKAPD